MSSRGGGGLWEGMESSAGVRGAGVTQGAGTQSLVWVLLIAV